MSASGDRIALRTTLRDKCRSRMIALMAFPAACSRRILNTVSNTNIPISPPDTCQASSLDHRDEGSFSTPITPLPGSFFHADPQGNPCVALPKECDMSVETKFQAGSPFLFSNGRRLGAGAFPRPRKPAGGWS
jgi:hypothetical protein